MERRAKIEKSLTSIKFNKKIRMDIALIGYGKMGKAIEEVAIDRGHKIVLKISKDNLSAFSESNLRMANVVIEFSTPDAVLHNIMVCLNSGVPVVCGTTGWNNHLDKAKERCMEENGTFLQSSNFSVGVNLFFELNKYLANLMNNWSTYDVCISETHHTEKKDAPSGTAITLAEQILANLNRKKHWHKADENESEDAAIIPIHSFRENNIPGTHQVKYSSEIDDIEIIHTAHSRKGFAIGAVLAAEFIYNKKGIFSMEDVLFNRENS